MLRQSLFGYFLVLLFFAQTNVWGQAHNLEESYIHYTLESGLPTSTIYNCVQDRNGFMWFGSFAGLIRFDGHDFFTFTQKDGLPDNEIISTSIDSFGRVWAYPYSKTPIYIQQNKIYSKKNDSVLKRVENTGMDKFPPSNMGGMWLYGGIKNKQAYIYYYDKHYAKTYTIPTKNKPIAYNYRDTVIQIICSDSIIYPQDMRKNIYFPFQPTRFKESLQPFFEYSKEGFYLIFNAGQTSIIRQYKNQKDKPYPILEKEITLPKKIWASYYHDDKLFIAFRAGGYTYLDSDFSTFDSTKIFLKNAYIGGMTADKEGNLWFATMGDGIYSLPRHPIYKLTNPANPPNIITQALFKDEDGELFLGNSKGEIQRFDVQCRLHKSKQIGTGQYNRILHIEKSIFHPEDLYIVSDEGFFIWHNYKKHASTVDRITQQATKTLFQSAKRQSVLVGTSGYLYEYNPFVKENKVLLKKRITAICETKKGDVYFTSLDGLYKIGADSIQYLAKLDAKFEARITALLPYKDNGLWMATSSDGLLLMENDKVITHINKSTGLISDILTKLSIDAKGNIWIGTNKGLHKMYLLNGDPNRVHLSLYSMQNGLMDDNINDIAIQNDSIWISTYKGLSFFHNFEEERAKAIPMYITQVSINSVDTLLQPEYILAFDQNTISLDFTGICLACNEELYYYYRLLGAQSDWQMTRQKQVSFGALSPGTYTFEVYAMDTQNPITRIKFVILPPWWKTNWAMFLWALLVIAAITALTFVLLSYYRNRIQQKYQQEKHIKELEIQALRAQMNPHFIFNCLSSIQYFMNSGDLDSANIYMDKFAKLIRKTLHFSQDAINSVADEIAYIDNYLQLEQMRFEDKFHYKIEIEEDLDTEDVFLPSLILQPFVENAIRHGLRFKLGKEGFLWIRFYHNSEFLICEIEDNGIGREKASALKSKQHIEYQSQGMLLSANRLSLFNTPQNQKMKMEVIDLVDEQKVARGTLIRVYITLNF